MSNPKDQPDGDAAGDLPRRFSGQLDIPEPLWFETDLETLRRVRDALINLPAETTEVMSGDCPA